MGPSGRWYKSGWIAPNGLAGPQFGSTLLLFGGNSNGDKQRPSFGEMHMVPVHVVLLANAAKLLGLGSLVSFDAGDGHRASKLIARNGLEARVKWNNDPSFAAVLRPSGPYARICGDDPRCACKYWIILFVSTLLLVASEYSLIVWLVCYLNYFD